MKITRIRLSSLVCCSAGLMALGVGCSSSPDGEPAVETTQQRIIYGQDDRTNVAQHADARAALWANSVGMLGAADTLCPGDTSDPTCEPILQPAQTLVLTGEGTDPAPGPLCADQRFSSEARPATQPCAAFYVGNNRFVTAAHCLEAADCGDPVEGKGVLFGFETDVLGNTPTSMRRQGNFYTCDRILVRDLQVFDPGRIDYAVFEVTPPVTGHRALPLRRTGIISAGPPAEATPATPLGIIGHGLGFPLKASFNGQARNNVNTNFFYHTIDGFPGDSGSPVINLEEGIVEGIHVAGPVPQSGVPPQANFKERNAGTPQRCLEYTSCAENACPANQVNRQWSQATRITRAQLLAQVPELPPEEAQKPQEHVMIVLDRTGSMTLDGTTPGLTRWDEAINAAMAWVGVDSLSASFLRRAYSVWTFRRGGGQDRLEQVWPTPDDTNCSAVDDASGFCVFEPVDLLATPTDYLSLQAELEELRESLRPVPGPSTPLAESLCEALEVLRPLPPLQRIIFQADGGENSSLATHPCAGDDSADFENPFENPELFAEPDWGMSPDSWQAKIIRRATRLDRLIEDATDGALTSFDRFPSGLIWNVDVHYAVEAAPEQQLSFFASLAGPSQQGASLLEWEGIPSESSSFSFLALAAAPQATTTDILPSELSLLRSLGSSNGLSTFHSYVRPLEPVVYGVDHALAGDVDDSGCVDQADLSIVTQSDVWQQRAVRPLEIATRADLNRDGWVNFADLQMVLSNWGSACINPPSSPNLRGIVLPRPGTCDDDLRNGPETDVDCGGDCGPCPVGSSCTGPSDCATGICTAQVCQAQPAFDVCQCRPSKCGDCSSARAACAATPGCQALVACTYQNACNFPHENCSGGQSCHQITGYSQSSAAGQAANNVISCLGGC